MPQQKQKSVEEILAEAKAALSKSRERAPEIKPVPKPQPPKEHEYSKTPYKMARPKKETGIKKEAKDAGSGIAYRLKQQQALKGQ